MTRRRIRSEQGASLILALMFTTSIAFMLAASLDFASASFGQSTGQATFRDGTYAASGAADTLLHAMRGDATWGRSGEKCPGVTLELGDGRTAVATCLPEPGSGVLLSGGSGARANRVVNLTVTVGETEVLRARVVFVDGGGATPGSVVDVKEWNAAL